ncbi:hypothetical protein GCM10020256_64200 [Streptomyces thermocoprophilus]
MCPGRSPRTPPATGSPGTRPPNAPRATASTSPSPSSSPSGSSASSSSPAPTGTCAPPNCRTSSPPWARGEGYASEAALATAHWLFSDQAFERIELRTAADNTAAQQVAQKIGCISEGVLRNACIAHVRTEDGTWTDVRTDYIVWSLLPEDMEGTDEQFADVGGFATYADWN